MIFFLGVMHGFLVFFLKNLTDFKKYKYTDFIDTQQ